MPKFFRRFCISIASFSSIFFRFSVSLESAGGAIAASARVCAPVAAPDGHEEGVNARTGNRVAIRAAAATPGRAGPIGAGATPVATRAKSTVSVTDTAAPAGVRKGTHHLGRWETQPHERHGDDSCCGKARAPEEVASRQRPCKCCERRTMRLCLIHGLPPLETVS